MHKKTKFIFLRQNFSSPDLWLEIYQMVARSKDPKIQIRVTFSRDPTWMHGCAWLWWNRRREVILQFNCRKEATKQEYQHLIPATASLPEVPFLKPTSSLIEQSPHLNQDRIFYTCREYSLKILFSLRLSHLLLPFLSGRSHILIKRSIRNLQTSKCLDAYAEDDEQQ